MFLGKKRKLRNGLCTVLGFVTAFSMAFTMPAVNAAPSIKRVTDATTEDYLEKTLKKYNVRHMKGSASLKAYGGAKLSTSWNSTFNGSEGPSNAVYVTMKKGQTNTKRIGGKFAEFITSDAFDYYNDNNVKSSVDVVLTFSNLYAKMNGQATTTSGNLVVLYQNKGDVGVDAASAPVVGSNFGGGLAYSTMDIKLTLRDHKTKKTLTKDQVPNILWHFGDIDIGDNYNPGGPSYGSDKTYYEKVALNDSDPSSIFLPGKISNLTNQKSGDYRWFYNSTGSQSKDGQNYYQVDYMLEDKPTVNAKWEGSGCGTYIGAIYLVEYTGSLTKTTYDYMGKKDYAENGYLDKNQAKKFARFRVTIQYHNDSSVVSKPKKLVVTDTYSTKYFNTPKWDEERSSEDGRSNKWTMKKENGKIMWISKNVKNIPVDTNITFNFTLNITQGKSYDGLTQKLYSNTSFAQLKNNASLTIDGNNAADDEAYPWVPIDELMLTKSVNKNEISNPKADKDSVTYTYTVKNNGTSTLYNVNIITDKQKIAGKSVNYISPSDLTIKSVPKDSGQDDMVGKKNTPSDNANGTKGITLKKGQSVKYTYTLTLSKEIIDKMTDGNNKYPLINEATAYGFNKKTSARQTATDNAQFKITEEQKKGQIKIVKKDATTGHNIVLSGAKFWVYKDLNGNNSYDTGDENRGHFITSNSGLVSTITDDDYKGNTNRGQALGEALSAARFEAGTYFIRETIAPWRYSLNDDIATVTISEADLQAAAEADPPYTYVATAIISNSEIYGTLTVHKEEAESENDQDMITTLAGNTFQLTAEEDICYADDVDGDNATGYSKKIRYAKGTVFDTKTTDDDGYVTFSGIPMGYWRVTETGVGAGFVSGQAHYYQPGDQHPNNQTNYDPSDDFDEDQQYEDAVVLITNMNDGHMTDLEYEMTVSNPPTMTWIRKLDIITGQPLEGAIFTVLDGSTPVATFTSTIDNNGWYRIAGLTVGKTYTVHEDKAPDYYVATSKDTSFTVQNTTDHYDITVYNEPEKCILTVKKKINANDVWMSDRPEVAHGNPTFIVKITGTDFYGNNVSYEVPFTFTYSEIKAKQGTSNPMIEKSQNIEVRHGEYTTSELSVSRYEFENIYDLNHADDNGDATADIDLTDPTVTSAMVGYQNRWTRYDKWSHKNLVVNDFTSNYTNDGPYGRPWAGSHGTGTLS